MHTVSLRYFTVFGPRQRPDMSIHRLCEAAVDGTAFPRYGDGTQIREFTYVGDIVARQRSPAADARRRARARTCNLAGGGEITLNDADRARSASSPARRSRSTPQPQQAGDAFRNGGAIDRARDAARLGARSVSLRDGVAAQLAWHRARVRSVDATRGARRGAR